MSEAERVCSEVVGSASGELFYRCAAGFAGWTHWSGPFFTALLIGFIGAALIAMIVRSA